MSKGPDTVYILKSQRHLNRYYTGITTDIKQRLEFHNAGLSKHTATGTPWALITTIQFSDETRAEQFEHYLKSGSGRAFATRHFR
jgi:putative endonuclease